MRTLSPPRLFLLVASVPATPGLRRTAGKAHRKHSHTSYLIAVDDMNDWDRFFGRTHRHDYHTPNIDRLAASFHGFYQRPHPGTGLCAHPCSHPYRGTPCTLRGRKRVLGRWPEVAGNFEALKEVVTLEQFFQQNGSQTLRCGVKFTTVRHLPGPLPAR